jgi:hypothetical protein
MSSRLALAMSAAGLVVALLGATSIGQALVPQVPRNSVGSLQLKRNAVTARKLSPNAVRTGHVLDGSLLAADFKAGQIPAGPAGPAGPPGVSERQVVSAESANDSSALKQAAVLCPAGKQALGGGANLVPISIQVSIARSIPGGTNGWLAVANEIGAGTPLNWRVQVYAICAKVS